MKMVLMLFRKKGVNPRKNSYKDTLYTILMSITEVIKSTILELIGDLKDNIFTELSEQRDLFLVEFFFKKMPSEDIANRTVKYILPHQSQISARNVQFFIDEKAQIFAGLPDDKIVALSILVSRSESDGGMLDENKDIIWSYFDTLVELAKEYKKNK